MAETMPLSIKTQIHIIMQNKQTNMKMMRNINQTQIRVSLGSVLEWSVPGRMRHAEETTNRMKEKEQR